MNVLISFVLLAAGAETPDAALASNGLSIPPVAAPTLPVPAPARATSVGPGETNVPARTLTAGREYRLGPGDVIEVAVMGNAGLSRTARVQTNGAAVLPLLGDVQVAQLTVGEARARIQQLLGDYLVQPQVEVAVREYQSQFVTVLGEVNSPGRKPLRGRARLIDVLVEAGGFTTRSSGEVSVTRREGTFENGGDRFQVQIGSRMASAADQANLEVELSNGDVVVVAPKVYVVVEGEVAQAGRFVMESELTVSGAISMAGGLTRFGGNKVAIRRVDPDTQAVSILNVDLKAIRNGKALDVPLQARDTVTVPRKLF